MCAEAQKYDENGQINIPSRKMPLSEKWDTVLQILGNVVIQLTEHGCQTQTFPTSDFRLFMKHSVEAE